MNTDAKLRNISKGKLKAAEILDKDTILLIVKTIRKTPKELSPTGQERPKSIPNPVATALPPFHLSQTGQIWPANAANPIKTCQESLNKKYFAIE